MQDPRITDFLTSLQLERDASPHTITAYRTDLADLQAYLMARGLELDAVTGQDLEPFALELRERGLAPATVRRRLAAARSGSLAKSGALAHVRTSSSSPAWCSSS